MPIEIKELHIKITVDEGKPSSTGNTGAGTDKQKIIAECVEQVMEILDAKKER